MPIGIIFLCIFTIIVSACSATYKSSTIANEITANFSKAVEEKNSAKFRSLFLN